MRKTKVVSVKSKSVAFDPANAEPKPATLRQALERIKYLDGEINMKEIGRTAALAQVEGFDAMKTDIDEIALYFRENMKHEIEQGYHAGRGLGVIVVGYLQLLKDVKDSLRKQSDVYRQDEAMLQAQFESARQERTCFEAESKTWRERYMRIPKLIRRWYNE